MPTNMKTVETTYFQQREILSTREFMFNVEYVESVECELTLSKVIYLHSF